MTAYRYRALNTEGKLVKGVLEGDSERQVRSNLRGQDMRPVEVGLANKEVAAAAGFGKLAGQLPRLVATVIEDTAENLTIAFLKQYVSEGKSPMCGNSICQDRRFLARYMPTLEVFFHYRNLDVSTLKELTSRWAPEKKMVYAKESSHLAMDDIKDSIDELKHYRETILSI